jgi:hypothetical protein
MPEDTRRIISNDLRILENKSSVQPRRKHSNLPLPQNPKTPNVEKIYT